MHWYYRRAYGVFGYRKTTGRRQLAELIGRNAEEGMVEIDVEDFDVLALKIVEFGLTELAI